MCSYAHGDKKVLIIWFQIILAQNKTLLTKLAGFKFMLGLHYSTEMNDVNNIPAEDKWPATVTINEFKSPAPH
jgi:biotin-(acetyl-CoA carboxylase) ligase